MDPSFIDQKGVIHKLDICLSYQGTIDQTSGQVVRNKTKNQIYKVGN